MSADPNLPAGQNDSARQRLVRGQSRMFGFFREQNRTRFRAPIDRIEVAGLTMPVPYYAAMKERVFDSKFMPDIWAERLGRRAAAMLCKQKPIAPMALKGVVV